MSQVSKIFRRFIPQFLHMIVLSIFFFAFMLIYRPANCVEFMGGEWFGVHLTICSCIVFLSAIITLLVMDIVFAFFVIERQYSVSYYDVALCFMINPYPCPILLGKALA